MDPLSERDERRLIKHLNREMGPYLDQIAERKYDRVIGTSGTILSLGALASSDHHSVPIEELRNRRVGAKALHRLRKKLTSLSLEERLAVPGSIPAALLSQSPLVSSNHRPPAARTNSRYATWLAGRPRPDTSIAQRLNPQSRAVSRRAGGRDRDRRSAALLAETRQQVARWRSGLRSDPQRALPRRAGATGSNTLAAARRRRPSATSVTTVIVRSDQKGTSAASIRSNESCAIARFTGWHAKNSTTATRSQRSQRRTVKACRRWSGCPKSSNRSITGARRFDAILQRTTWRASH